MNLKGNYNCQTCNNPIESPKQGWIQWQDNDESQYYGFRIVHHKIYSPYRYTKENGCYPYKSDVKLNDLPLECFYGYDGMAFLISMGMRESINGKSKFVNQREYDKLFFTLFNIPSFTALS